MPLPKTATIKIKIGTFYCPMFGIYKWKATDHKTPLNFKIDNVEAKLFIQDEVTRFSSFKQKRHDLVPFSSFFIILKFNNPSSQFIAGLKSKRGEKAINAANKIHKIYEEVMTRFEILLRTVGGVKHLVEFRIASVEQLFKKDLSEHPVNFKLDNDKPITFEPVFPSGPRRKYPLFKADQLITTKKWNKMQKYIDNQQYANQEVVEILRIRARLLGKNKKLATLESAILFESLLRDYARRIIKDKGISNSKIQQLNDELNFNNILNLLLPFSLKKTELDKLKDDINAIDTLRGIRNKVVHGKITEEEIDENLVEKGIEGGLKLIKFLI